MRVLLLSMPDTAQFVDFFTRLPNLAIISLAGNLPGHEVQVLDLILFKPNFEAALRQALSGLRPQVVGLSAMTFQFDTLLRLARFIRAFDPTIKLVAGGYHVSLMARELTAAAEELPLDFLVRGEGETTFRELVTELEKPAPDLDAIMGLSYRQGQEWVHNPKPPLLELDTLSLPRRQARLANGFYFLDMPMEVAETSRGCPNNCKFCSIGQMYGHTFRRFSVERIISDLKAIRDQGCKAVFFVDDNITYDIDHFRQVCQAIVQHHLTDLCYLTQVTAAGIAHHPELVAEMDQANFRIAFVGFESMDPDALKGMKKPTNPEINRRAAAMLRQHRIAVIAGLIGGFPEDTRETLIRNWRMIEDLKPDLIYSQYLTPYPKTPVRQELLEAGLVVNADDYSQYDGFHCNIRTRHLSRDELYHLMRGLGFKSNFNISLIVNNRLLRDHVRYFLRSLGKVLAEGLYNLTRDLLPKFLQPKKY
ncbi:MAG: B12-binding domain-containing radical SAM protein [Desulfobaccales bacterium]